jgi:hypothetical protein
VLVLGLRAAQAQVQVQVQMHPACVEPKQRLLL